MGIGNFGLTELIVLAVLVLVFFGPNRLPEIARGVGKAMREFKKGMNEVQREFEEMERRQRRTQTEEERARARKEEGPKAGERVRPPGEESNGIPTSGSGEEEPEEGTPERVDRPEAAPAGESEAATEVDDVPSEGGADRDEARDPDETRDRDGS